MISEILRKYCLFLKETETHVFSPLDFFIARPLGSVATWLHSHQWYCVRLPVLSWDYSLVKNNSIVCTD